jgi:hypothetical protein
MSTIDLLRAHAPTAPEQLEQRVRMLQPAARRGRRVRPVLVLAAAATLAVGAALVHGLSTSAPQKRTLTLQDGPSSSSAGSTSGTPSTWATSTVPAATEKSLAPVTDSAKQRIAVPAPAPNRLQHTDASIRVRVDDVGPATNAATRVATRLGGYAQSVRYRTPQGGAAISYLELRIPAARVKEALAQLAGLGVLVSQQISIEDLTGTLERQSAQIAQLRRRTTALEAALRDTSLPDAQRVLLQIRLAESKRALAQRVHGRKGTVAAGTTARVSLVLTTQKHAAAAPAHRGRLGRMLHSAVGFLAIEGIVLLFALIVASPFAVALALLWWFRRRAVDRLLME